MDENTRYDAEGRPTTTGTPENAQKDRAAGTFQEAKGRVKESVGALTDNDRMRAEGVSEQTSGKVRNKKGQWKERLKSWIDRI